MSQDSTQTIQRSAVRFSLGTMASRCTGLLRDVAMAYAFGTDAAIATFMVAFRFAHLMRRLFGEGSLQNTFIPHFEELRCQNQAKALAFFRDLKASLSLVLVIFIAGAIGLLLVILEFFPIGEKTAQLLKLTCWMLPSLLFICLFGLNAALLACEKSYLTAGIAPVAFNLVWMAAALLLSSTTSTVAVVWMSVAVIIACAAQWLFTVPPTLAILHGSGELPSLQLFSPDVRRLASPLFLANIGVAASQINNAVDPLFALFANSEGPAWLWFAMRIQQLPIALFGVALSSALLPPIARAIKSGNQERFVHFFHFARRRIASLTIPLSCGIIATAPACINLLFGRGQFDISSVAGSALCLSAYGIGLFPMAFILIAAPTLYAQGDFKRPARSSLITMLLSVLLNVLCIFVWKLGAASVAFATSAAAFWNAFYLQRVINTYISTKDPAFNYSLLSTLCASFVAMGAVFSIDYILLGEIPIWNVLMGLPLSMNQHFYSELMVFGAESAVFITALMASAFCFRSEDILGWIRRSIKEYYP
jgi:putative peptidoglycan lipid II flippase